jgi:hypothetical protein
MSQLFKGGVGCGVLGSELSLDDVVSTLKDRAAKRSKSASAKLVALMGIGDLEHCSVSWSERCPSLVHAFVFYLCSEHKAQMITVEKDGASQMQLYFSHDDLYHLLPFSFGSASGVSGSNSLGIEKKFLGLHRVIEADIVTKRNLVMFLGNQYRVNIWESGWFLVHIIR